MFSLSKLFWQWFFFTHIFFPKLNVYTADSYYAVYGKKCRQRTATHVQGKSHNYVETKWAHSGWSCLPSEVSRPPGFHGNGMMHIKPCSNCHSVRGEVHAGQHVGRSKPHTSIVGGWAPWAVILEVCLYWCKGWSIRWEVNLMKNIIYIFHLLATTVIRLQS